MAFRIATTVILAALAGISFGSIGFGVAVAAGVAWIAAQ